MKFISYFDCDSLRDLNFYKLLVLVICLVLIYFIVEPEKIKYTSTVGALVVSCSLVYIWIVCISREFPSASQAKLWDFTYFPNLVGAQVYSLEGFTTLLCVRSTMKNRSQANIVVYVVMGCAIVFFSLNGALLANSFYSPKTISFFYFKKDVLIRVLEALFYLIIPTLLIIVLLATLTTLEAIPWVRSLLTIHSGTDALSIKKIKIFRMAMTSLIVLPGFFGRVDQILMNTR